MANFFGGGSNPFKDFTFDRGTGIDPFTALRGSLGARLFNNANIFGDQGLGFLSSQGRFDPNLAEAMRQHQFGVAQSSLSDALANLAGQEGTFREGQRQFNTTMDFNRLNAAAEWDAAQPNALDWLTGIGTLGLGLGTFGTAGGFKGIGSGVNWLLNFLKGDKSGGAT